MGGRWLLKALNVRPGEEGAVGLMVCHAFSMGISTVFFETAASALFLARFGEEVLPFVYIIGAVINTAVGLGYDRARERMRFSRLMSGTLILLLVVVCGLRLGLAFGQIPVLVFFLLIWYRAISILTDLEYWAVAARLFDVRQSKRLYSLIGVGEVVARIGGAFSVPLLLPFLGVANLLVVSAGGLAASLLLLGIILRTYASRVGDATHEAASAAGEQEPISVWTRLRRLFDERYLTLIIVLAILGVLGKYFVDFAFLSAMKGRLQDAERLASFFALFSGSVQVLNLLIRIFVSGRVLTRFGIRAGLLVLPLTHLVCTALIAFGHPLFGVGAVFWLVIANQGVYKTFKHPFDNPSFKILYQPLKKERRLAAQVAVETIITPVTTGVAGLVMLLFSTVIPFDPVVFAWAMLVTFAAWCVVAVLVYREYLLALTRALSRRFFDDDAPFSIADEKSIALIRAKLGSSYPGDVVFALDLLDKAGHPSLAGHLLELVDHPEAEVRRFVLLKLEEVEPPGAAEVVRRRLASESEPLVRAAALRALAVLEGEEAVPELVAHLGGDSPLVRQGAMIGLLLAQGSEARARARATLGEWVRSSATDERRLAARVVAEVSSAELGEELAPLIGDPEPAVGREALRAAGRLGDGRLWPLVADQLGSRRYRGAAVAALVAGGESALPEVAKRLEETRDREQQVRLVAAIAGIGGPRALELLRARLDVADGTVRREVVAALRRCAWQASGEEGEGITRRVREEAGEATWRLAAVEDLGEADELAIVRSALLGELEQARDRILYLLSLVFDRRAIERAHRNLGAESQERRAYALEVVDVTLPSELKAVVLPLLEDRPPASRLRRLAHHFPQTSAEPGARLEEILHCPRPTLGIWTRCCAAYAAVATGDPQLRKLAEAYFEEVARLEGERTGACRAEVERRTMLKVERVIILKTVNLFSKIPEEVLAEVAETLEEQEFGAGEVVFDKGDLGDALYIIASGRVRVYDGDKTINVIGEREIFGELAALDPEPRSASIAAEEATVLFRLDREALFELMADRVDVAQAIVSVICQRLRRMTNIAMGRG